MKILKWIAFSLVLMAFGFGARGQQANGITILSADSSQPIIGALCVFSPVNTGGKRQVLITDANGHISFPGTEHYLIMVQLPGYKTLMDTVASGSNYTFKLVRDRVNLDEVVVTGQFNMSTSDKSVYTIRVIDAKQIASRAATSLDQLLQTELNMRLSEDNILGSSVSINGLSGQNVKILMDGVPIIGRENGNIDLSQINLNDIERVEIIEGPMSVMYGTDAVGGLINLITRQNSAHKIEANLNLSYETIGRYNADGSLLFKQKKSHLSVSGGRYFFGGFNVPDTGRFQQWKPYEQIFGAVEYGFKTTYVDGQLRVDGFHQLVENNGQPIVTPYEADALDTYYRINRFNVSLINQIRLKNAATIQLTNAYSFYQRIDNSYYNDLTTLTKSLITEGGSQDSSKFTNIVLRGVYNQSAFSKVFSYQVGYDIGLQSGTGTLLNSGQNYINDYAAFGSFQVNVQKLQIRPGLRLAYNTKYGAPVIPSLNLKYDANNRVQLRASYSRGFRAPALQELDLDFVDVNHNIHGNPDLKAEHSDHYNFNVSYLSNYAKRVLKLSYNIYYNNIANIITLAEIDNSSGYYSYINVDKYQTVGNSVNAQLSAGILNFETGFSLTGLYNSVAAQYPGVDKFSFTPEFTASAGLHFKKLQSGISLYVKNTGTTPGFAINSQQQVYQTTISSFTIMDLILQKSFLKNRINFSAGIKNLLNVININSTVPGGIHSANDGFMPYATGRNFFVKLNFKIYNS